ncbi:MAG: DNA-directed RNA polymerase subunit alpha [Caldisericia bacterium]|nr:DNA-directed RNA polymerase subunit alpha [Caldisericia bacterium]
MRTTLEELNLSVISENAKRAEYVIGPLHKGYGVTIGNSLRRVLLSSIEGVAVVAVYIEGISHQFSSIPGVLEDGIQIVSNIKNLVIKSRSGERKVLEINKKGKGPVRAADLICPEGIEIINPDLVLMNIVDGEYSLSMQLYIEESIEYRLAEENRGPSYPINTFFIDSLFCPIQHVSFNVKQIMVKESLDFENVDLEIETNGAIDPRTALDQASKIMVDYFRNLMREQMEEDVVELKDTDDTEEILSRPLEEIIPLSVRTGNVFKKAGIYTVNDLFEKSKKDLLGLKNFGAKSLFGTIEELLKVPEIGSLKNRERFPLLVEFAESHKQKAKGKTAEKTRVQKAVLEEVEAPSKETSIKKVEAVKPSKAVPQFDTLSVAEALKLSIDDVAKNIGISQKQLGKLKKYAISKIEDLVDVTREQLLTGDHKITKKNVERIEEFLRHNGLSLKED